MPINQGTSLDMNYDTDTALEFVNSKDPGSIEFDLSDYYSTHGNGAGYLNQYVSSMGNATDDVNDDGWGNAINGEWWLTDSGEIYADGNIGDQGHEAIAINNMFRDDEALDIVEQMILELSEDSDKKEDLEYLQSQIEENMSEEFGSSSVFFNTNIPDDIGRQCVDKPEIWDEMKRDPITTFAKYYGAIRVAGPNFQTYKLTDTNLKYIIDFFMSEMSDVSKDTKIYISQMDPMKDAELSINQLLFANYANDVWNSDKLDYPEGDVNDFSLGDAWDAVSGVGKTLLQGVGLMNPDKKEPEEKVSTPAAAPKQSLPQQPQRAAQSEEHIKQLQTYFQNPSSNLRSFIGGMKYSGPIDGKDGSGTRAVVSALESSLNKLFNTRRFSGAVMSTSSQDIEAALQKANAYKSQSQTPDFSAIMATRTNRDERFYKLGKKLISKI